MAQETKAKHSADIMSGRQRRGRDIRPLTTDERASFAILSLYMATFCVITFVYWDSLLLKILGVTAASAGVFLFVAAFFNTEAPEKSTSIHPLRSYLLSFFFVLLTLFVVRLISGLITNFIVSIIFIYVGLLLALIIFRKHMVQVISTMAVLVFLFATFHNLNDILGRRMGFKDVARQCGQAVFRIGPIQDISNMLLAGSYVTYLNRIDYRNPQINMLATKKVAKSTDDDLLKATALLNFVSNDIHYISDPEDGLEFARNPIDTLIAGAGDCEDQALLLCSLLESVGVKTYMAFTDNHVFILARFSKEYPELNQAPYVYIDEEPCYALDPADPGAVVGSSSARPAEIERIFDTRQKSPVRFSLPLQE